MPKLFKDNVTLSIRFKGDLLERIDSRIQVDPRFVSRSEYLTFSIKKVYGDIMTSIYGDVFIGRKAIDQDKFDQIMVENMVNLATNVATSLMIFESFDGEPEVIQIKLPKPMMPLIDTVCSLTSIRRTDFIKHAIINETVIFDTFYLGTDHVYVLKSDEESIPLQLKMGADWQTSIKKKVIESLATRKLNGGSQAL